MTPLQEQLRDLFLKYSVTTGDFTLVSGRKTTWYCVGRDTTFRGDAAPIVGKAIMEAIEREGGVEFDSVGGLVVGAIPVSMAVAIETGKRSFAVRKEAKDHGDASLVAGPLQPGDRVLVAEDTVTTGGSIMKAIDGIEAAGATVVAVACLMDRGGEFGPVLDKKGIPFIAVLGAPDLGFPYGS